MNFEKITNRIEQINSLVHSLEGALIEADNGSEQMRRTSNLFYVLLEQIKNLKEEANELSEHIEVCNAIFAVNHVNELKKEIELLKSCSTTPKN